MSVREDVSKEVAFGPDVRKKPTREDSGREAPGSGNRTAKFPRQK